MMLPLVVMLLQAQTPVPSSQPDPKPVRVWLGGSNVFQRGSPVHVYVQTTTAGNLVVLHRRTDGQIDVLFPANPSDDPFIRPGTYEIRDVTDSEAFVVAEPDGSGLILAALSPSAYRFDEFVQTASWNPDALVPSWSATDAEGAASDIVQRMLGDGSFNYDLVTYTVTPPSYALDTTTPYPPYSFADHSIGGAEFVVVPPFFFARPFRRHGRFSESAGTSAPATVLGLTFPHAPVVSGVNASAPYSPLLKTPSSKTRTPGITPRVGHAAAIGNGPSVRPRAIPLFPGHRAAHPGGRDLATRAAAPYQVWLTSSLHAPRESAPTAGAPEPTSARRLVPVRGGAGYLRSTRAAVELAPRGRVAAPGSAVIARPGLEGAIIVGRRAETGPVARAPYAVASRTASGARSSETARASGRR